MNALQLLPCQRKAFITRLSPQTNTKRKEKAVITHPHKPAGSPLGMMHTSAPYTSGIDLSKPSTTHARVSQLTHLAFSVLAAGLQNESESRAEHSKGEKNLS